MKIRVTLKDPDTMPDAVNAAMDKEPKPDGITGEEWAGIRDARADRIKGAIMDAWMEYGEYLCVEFEVDDHGNAIAARVMPTREGEGTMPTRDELIDLWRARAQGLRAATRNHTELMAQKLHGEAEGLERAADQLAAALASPPPDDLAALRARCETAERDSEFYQRQLKMADAALNWPDGSGTGRVETIETLRARVAALEAAINDVVGEERHSRDCGGWQGPEDEQWLASADCDCYMRDLRAALAAGKE